MDKIKIKAEERVEQGSAAVRRLRRAGKIPAAVMRMNKGGTLLVKLDEHEFLLGLRGHTSKQLLVTLDMDGKEMPALMREMQNDVVKGTPIHVDFSEVSLTQKVRVVVPIQLAGEAVGVKIGGGVLEQVLRSVEVECLPEDIAEKFTVDVSKLGLDQTLFVKDLQLGDKFTLVTRGEYAVAVVIREGPPAGRQVHAGDARRVRGGGREGAGGRGRGEARRTGRGGQPGGHQEGQGRGRRREEGREEVTREGT